MTWATVSSRSCFCNCIDLLHLWLQISLISVLTIWWCLCLEFSLVLLEEGVCYDQCVLLAKLYQPLPCFSLYSKSIFACYSRCFLTSFFCIPVPYNEKNIFFCVLVLKSLVGLHRTIQLQLLQHYWSGHRLGLSWYWMISLETNRDHSVIFEIASKHFGLFSWLWWLFHFF